MVAGIQLVGLVFGLVMLYLTYFYLRRNDFRKGDAILWFIVWTVFLFGILFPQRLDILLETFGILGALQLFTIAAILFLTSVIFYMYRTVRKNQKQVEDLVREIALQKR